MRWGQLDVTDRRSQREPVWEGDEPGAELSNYAVDNGDVLVFDLVYYNLANIGLGEKVPVPEKEEVASLESRLHAAGENDDDRRGAVGEYGEAFPHLSDGQRQAGRRRRWAEEPRQASRHVP